MMDRAPSEQHRGCRGIQAGGSPLLPRYGLQARWSTLDLAGPAREDSRDSHTQGLCDPARPALDPGRSREFSRISGRATATSEPEEAQTPPRPALKQLGPERSEAIMCTPHCSWLLGRLGSSQDLVAPLREGRCRERA